MRMMHACSLRLGLRGNSGAGTICGVDALIVPAAFLAVDCSVRPRAVATRFGAFLLGGRWLTSLARGRAAEAQPVGQSPDVSGRDGNGGHRHAVDLGYCGIDPFGLEPADGMAEEAPLNCSRVGAGQGREQTNAVPRERMLSSPRAHLGSCRTNRPGSAKDVFDQDSMADFDRSESRLVPVTDSTGRNHPLFD